MKKFLFKTFLVFLPIFIYFIFAINLFPYLLKHFGKISTQDQLEISFNNVLQKKFDLLMLGNSRIYRGLNPDKFSIDSYNFSHDNDSYNQLYYKLKYLEKNNVNFHYLILGIDYFQFSYKSDTRNYIYNELLDSEYSDDFHSSLLSLKFNQYKKLVNPKSLLTLFSIRPQFIKDNGQYILEKKATIFDEITNDINRLPFQVEYFDKIIKYCKNKNITLFFVMPPVRKNAFKNYNFDQIKEFQNFIKNKNTVFWNFDLDKTYNIGDYTDIAHLNSEAADRFSLQLNDSIKKYLLKHNKNY